MYLCPVPFFNVSNPCVLGLSFWPPFLRVCVYSLSLCVCVCVSTYVRVRVCVCVECEESDPTCSCLRTSGMGDHVAVALSVLGCLSCRLFRPVDYVKPFSYHSVVCFPSPEFPFTRRAPC